MTNLFGAVVPFDAKKHAALSLDTSLGYGFASRQSAASLQVGEFAAAAREFPIVFLEKDKAFTPVAVLGLARDENLFVDSEAARKASENLFAESDVGWEGNYVPAVFRIYPFVLMHHADGDRVVLGLAQDHPGLNADGVGLRLFERDGAPSQLTRTAQEFAKHLARQGQMTLGFCADLQKLDILSPIQMKLTGPGDTERAVGGMFVVDRKKLAALDADVVHGLFKSGALEAIYLHLASLRNFRELAKRIGREADMPDTDGEGDLAFRSIHTRRAQPKRTAPQE